MSAACVNRNFSGGVVAQLGEPLRTDHGSRFPVNDVPMKNTRLGLEIGNHTSHVFLRSMGHVPLQQAREDWQVRRRSRLDCRVRSLSADEAPLQHARDQLGYRKSLPQGNWRIRLFA